MVRRTKEKAEARKQEIIRLFKMKDRPTLEEIGEQVGATKQWVSAVLREAGFNPEESEDVDVSDTISEIRNLSGWSNTDIGTVMDIARESISRYAGGKKAALAYARRLNLLAEGLRQAAENNRLTHK